MHIAMHRLKVKQPHASLMAPVVSVMSVVSLMPVGMPVPELRVLNATLYIHVSKYIETNRNTSKHIEKRA